MYLSDDISSLVPKLLMALNKHGNMSKAAKDLGVSQPAGSKALRHAEKRLGLKLVKRDKRPLTLTSEGKILAEYAERIEVLDNIYGKKIEMMRKLESGLVRIASFGASSSTNILPELLTNVSRNFPDIQLEIIEMTDSNARTALEEEIVDFATIVADDDLELDIIPLAQDRLVALVNESHPICERQEVTVDDLSLFDFIMSKGGSEPLIRSWFEASGRQPNVRHTALQLTSILAMVRAGLGVSVVAEMAVPKHHPNVCVIPLSPEQPRSICLARKSGNFTSVASEKIWNFLEDYILQGV